MLKVSIIVFSLFLPVKLFAQYSFVESREILGVDASKSNYGLAIGDFNNDGFDDLFIARNSYQELNVLYQNINGEYFEDVSHLLKDDSRNSVTGLWVDIDNNGHLDLIVVNARERKRIYLNYGNGVFKDFSEESGINDLSNPKSFNAGDLNADGFVDLFENNFRDHNFLYINKGDGSFINAVEGSGADNLKNAMGAVIFDYDNDNDLDIFLTYDGQSNDLYENDGNAKFINVARRLGLDNTAFGMGVDVSDINFDGFHDIYITNLNENLLFCSNMDSAYSDKSFEAGIQDMGMGWGINFLDIDNDGNKEIYVVNEFSFSPYENVLYKNNRNLSFEAIEVENLASRYNGYGSAISDIDNDGQMDILVANYNHSVEIFKNNSVLENNWINIRLYQKDKNTFCIGCKVKIRGTNEVYTDIVKAGNSYLSQSSYSLHFGLGNITKVIVDVIWDDGEIETFNDITANESYAIVRGEWITSFSESKLNEIFPSEDPPEDDVIQDLQNTEIYIQNPFDEHLRIKFSTAGNKQMFLYSQEGKIVLRKQTLESDIYLNTSFLDPGVYILKTQESNSVNVYKIIKK